MRIRTGIAAAVAATAMVLGASSAAVATDGPKTDGGDDRRPVVLDGDGPTGIGLNLLCNLLGAKGGCSN